MQTADQTVQPATLSRTLGILALGLLWFFGGIVAPLRFVPSLLAATPLAPAVDPAVYVYVADPNVRSGDEAVVTLDDPSKSYAFTTVSYSCVDGLEVSLATNSDVHLPCGEPFHVDGFSELTFEPLSVHDAATYVQLDVVMTSPSGREKTAHPVLKVYPADAAMNDPLPVGVSILAN